MEDSKEKGQEQMSFDEYRSKMHKPAEEGRAVVPKPGTSVKIAYGIFMIIVYAGVGVLFLINFFKWETTALWDTLRIIVGVILIIYAIFRCYRMFRVSE